MATRKTADTKTKVGVQKTVSKASTDVVTAAAQEAAAAAGTKEAVKKEAVKAEPARETAAKEETAKKAAAPAKKADEAKAAEKKTAQKKAPAKKAAAKKEIKVKTYVQYMGREVEEKDMIAAVKKSWTKASGKKVGDIKSIDLYVKPEEGAVYYVVNGTDTGSVAY